MRYYQEELAEELLMANAKGEDGAEQFRAVSSVIHPVLRSALFVYHVQCPNRSIEVQAELLGISPETLERRLAEAHITLAQVIQAGPDRFLPYER